MGCLRIGVATPWDDCPYGKSNANTFVRARAYRFFPDLVCRKTLYALASLKYCYNATVHGVRTEEDGRRGTGAVSASVNHALRYILFHSEKKLNLNLEDGLEAIAGGTLIVPSHSSAISHVFCSARINRRRLERRK